MTIFGKNENLKQIQHFSTTVTFFSRNKIQNNLTNFKDHLFVNKIPPIRVSAKVRTFSTTVYAKQAEFRF